MTLLEQKEYSDYERSLMRSSLPWWISNTERQPLSAKWFDPPGRTTCWSTCKSHRREHCNECGPAFSAEMDAIEAKARARVEAMTDNEVAIAYEALTAETQALSRWAASQPMTT